MEHLIWALNCLMKMYPTYIENNRLYSFEIENLFCGRRKATRIVEGIQGVTITKRPKRWFSWFREDIFCEFELDGVKFQIDEPFGENSRYWIGSLQKENSKPIEIVLEAFNAA
ncbi:hypothetical protein [Microbulbifer sp. GL-2]|uniref:hypothetical protein n=1 Tax=Microbulbifer sp. GL-2 TaxID=2591606 RepID=UPI0011646FA1|nr:hypothetical protein [Microbulbifer sp. GL-2]BBM00126.1 hypothetical protein GL2_02000 [Microbulbifer sp. GL-2]